MRTDVSFVLNGRDRTVTCDPDVRLLYVLRDELGLTATHFGCGANQCGACHVLVDGHALPACDLPMWSLSGRTVVTLEGLGTPGTPHPLQTAFLAEQAGQCGYCLSGMMISAAALLAKNSDPSEDDIRAALEGNKCRCGAHNRIVRAIRRAARAGNDA